VAREHSRVAVATAAGAVLAAIGSVAFAAWMMTQPRPDAVFLTHSPFDSNGFVAGWGVLGVVWAVTGAVLVGVRPRNVLGWLILGVGVSQAWAVGLTAYGWGYGLSPGAPWWPAYLGPALYTPGWLIPPTLLLALYPDGRLPGRWWRWPVGAACVAILVLMVCVPRPVLGASQTRGWVMVPTFPEQLSDILLPNQPMYGIRTFVSVQDAGIPLAPHWWPAWTSIAGWVCKLLLVLSMLAIWVGTAVRLARAGPPRRQQLTLLMWVLVPFLAAALVAPAVANVLVLLSLQFVPLAVAAGALRYRLLGIEPVRRYWLLGFEPVRRGFAFLRFTATVVVAYLLVAAVAGVAWAGRPLPWVLATALVAVGLVLDRLQRAVLRLVYGSGRDPLRAVTRLGQRVADTSGRELLPGALTIVKDAVRAPGAAVTAPDGRIIAAVGTGSDGGHGSTVLPLRFGGVQVGELRVAAREDRRFTKSERAMLANLALQVAVVARAFELTEAMEAERDLVLTATAAEQMRLRDELHDGLGPSLSGVNLVLQVLAADLDRDDPPHAQDNERRAGQLKVIQTEVAKAVTEVRRIINGLQPTALDDRGLAGAICQYAEAVSTKLPVQVTAAALPPLSPDVTQAAYRITLEALCNAARHADADHIEVSLAAPDGLLRITVADDGQGMGAAPPGVGMDSMCRRATSLGGRLDVESTLEGTTITAVLPLEQQ